MPTPFDMAKALKERSTINPLLLGQSLGPVPESSGAFGGLETSELLGLGPEQVTSVAQTRSRSAYMKMLTDMGALDFLQKLEGTKEDRGLANTITAQAYMNEAALERTKLRQAGATKRSKIQASQAAMSPSQQIAQLKLGATKSVLEWEGMSEKQREGKEAPGPEVYKMAGFEKGLTINNALKVKSDANFYREHKDTSPAIAQMYEYNTVLEPLADAVIRRIGGQVKGKDESTLSTEEEGGLPTGKSRDVTDQQGNRYKQFQDGRLFRDDDIEGWVEVNLGAR